MNFRSLALAKHWVVRRPQCSDCGDTSLRTPNRSPAPMTLKSSPKSHRNSGGVHTVSAAVTLKKYQHLVSPISGVVSWLKRTTDETDTWLHVYWAGSNMGARGRILSSLWRASLRSKSAGKGSYNENSCKVCASGESSLSVILGSYQGDEICIAKQFREFAMDDEGKSIPTLCSYLAKYQLDNAQNSKAQCRMTIHNNNHSQAIYDETGPPLIWTTGLVVYTTSPPISYTTPIVVQFCGGTA